jgi:hypothetical protein
MVGSSCIVFVFTRSVLEGVVCYLPPPTDITPNTDTVLIIQEEAEWASRMVWTDVETLVSTRV